VLLLVTGVSLYLLLPSLIAVFSPWRSLSHLTWYWVALALVSEGACFILLWQLDRIALHVQSWFVVASSQLAGNAVGKIVPGGGATATAFMVEMLRRAGVAVGQAASALAASTSLQVETRLALPVVALPAIVAGTPIAHSLATSAYLGLAVLILLAVVGVLAFVFDRPLALAGRALQGGLNGSVRRRRKITDLPRRLLAQRDFVRATIGRHWRAAILSAVGSTAFDFGALLCALRAVGADPRPSTLAGVAPHDAVLATLTYRLVSYWLPIPAGGVAYVVFSRRYP
jgi:uncharacterized membrane protein YbhN (UPF0104 family)